MAAPQQTTFHVQLKAANDLGREDSTWNNKIHAKTFIYIKRI